MEGHEPWVEAGADERGEGEREREDDAEDGGGEETKEGAGGGGERGGPELRAAFSEGVEDGVGRGQEETVIDREYPETHDIPRGDQEEAGEDGK